MAWRHDRERLCTLTRSEAMGPGFDYCAENPCGAIESVRGPRANWCPGSVARAYVLESLDLATPGVHDFAISLNRLDTGGLWMLSATYIAYE